MRQRLLGARLVLPGERAGIIRIEVLEPELGSVIDSIWARELGDLAEDVLGGHDLGHDVCRVGEVAGSPSRALRSRCVIIQKTTNGRASMPAAASCLSTVWNEAPCE